MLTHKPLISYRRDQQKDAFFNVLDDSYSIGGEYFWGPYGNQNIINETSGIGVAVLGEGSFGYYRSVSQADHLRAGAGESFKACRDSCWTTGWD